jgi:serine/threonine/tyrosine-interacting protein
VRPRFIDNFSYLTLDVEDNEEQNLIRLFPQYARASQCVAMDPTLISHRAKLFIDNAISNGGRVLVHCNGTPPRFDLWQLIIA